MKKKISDMTNEQLKNFIHNHRIKRETRRSLYLEALDEEAKRNGHGLDFHKSIKAIRVAAAEGKFLSYKDLADVSGAEWSKVHYLIGTHLWSLVEYAHLKDWPMLSAIVVNKPNVDTGKMETKTLMGFVKAAKELGHNVVDEEEFLRCQQAAVFKWAQQPTVED